MSLLVVGISHRSAPLELLERISLDGPGASALATGVVGLEDVSESLVLTTCNRTEVYADVLGFHGAVAQVGHAIATMTGVPLDELTEHLYVHYEDRAVDHLFSLACGLESMALGESEILGQLREALRVGQQRAHLGAQLNPLFQQALRVGKRAHAETGLDQVARSLVGLGLERARDLLGPLERVRALVIGAGAMSGLAAASVVRAGAGGVHVLNRTPDRAQRLAQAHGGQAHDWSALPEQLALADLVITCTGATDHVITSEVLDRAGRTGGGDGAGRSAHGSDQAHVRAKPLVVVDLAMPRDVAPDVAERPGVTVWSLAELNTGQARAQDSWETSAVLDTVRDLVTGEVAAYLATRRSAQVGPTLAMMRSRATAVADAELDRLDEKLPGLSAAERAQVHQSVRRVVDKILHTPTVRARERAAQDEDGSYVGMLRELFDLDPRETATVDAPPRVSRLL